MFQHIAESFEGVWSECRHGREAGVDPDGGVEFADVGGLEVGFVGEVEERAEAGFFIALVWGWGM